MKIKNIQQYRSFYKTKRPGFHRNWKRILLATIIIDEKTGRKEVWLVYNVSW